jgi:type I restriction enzyme S subunit
MSNANSSNSARFGRAQCICISYYENLPIGWVITRLNTIGQIVGGGTPNTSEPSYWDNGNVPWITPADLSGYTEKFIVEGSRKISKKGLTESSAVLMPAGSVLFSSRAPIGYCVIAQNDVCTNQGFKSVVPFVSGMSEYIFYYLKSQVEAINARASGTTFKEISGMEFGNTVIVLPPFAEQQRIVKTIEVSFQQLDQIVKNLN